MNVIDMLGEALATKDWIKVEDVYKLLGGKDLFTIAMENFDEDDRQALKSIIDPPKKKRGRPRKVKEGDHIVAGNQEAVILPTGQINVDQRFLNAVYEGTGETAPKVSSTPDFTMHKNGPKNKTHSFEPFKTPEGPNLFDPKSVGKLEDPNVKVNDNVVPTSRSRPSPKSETIVFCEDCKKNVNIYPDKSRSPFYCEYLKFKQPCPRKTV